MSRKKIIFTSILSIAILTCSYFVAANYGFFSGGTNAPSVPEDTMTRGLVGYWEFDEGTGQTAYDASDSSNDGQLGSTASSDDNDPSWTGDGKNGGGMEFDGVDDYVDCGSGSSLDNLSNVTIEAWVYGKSDTNYERFYDKDDGIVVYLLLNKLVVMAEYTTTNLERSTYEFDLNKWQHVVVTWNGSSTASSLKIYINGTEVSSYDTSGNGVGDKKDDSANNLYISGRGANYNWNGSIDSVRIYNRALSADEVRYHYNRGGPVGSWNFDEGSGLTAFDGTSNNNDGTLKSSGLEFDGVNDYVDCGSDDSLDITDDITVSAWVKYSVVATSRIVSRHDGSPNYGWTFGVNTNRLLFGFSTTGTVWNEWLGDTILTAGNWYHVAAVRDYSSGNIDIYLNGTKDRTTVNFAGQIHVAPSNPLIGNETANGFKVNGSIDDVRIYNTALSAEEIARQYNGDFSQDPTANLVLLQHFEEGMACDANNEAGCLTDDSPSGTNDGTLKNFDNLTAWDNGTDGWISEVKKPEWRWVDGKYKTAGEFNGWDDYVETVNNIGITGNAARTVALWLKPGNKQAQQTLISFGNCAAGEILEIVYDYDPYCVDEGIAFTGWGGAYDLSGTTNTITRGEWNYVAVTYAGGSNGLASIYINGELDVSGNRVKNTINSYVRIGGPLDCTSYSVHFDGSIDDVRIYGYARTADEIRLDYNAGVATHLGPSGKTCSDDPAGCMDYGLVGSWSFDEGSGQGAYDASDNGNDGTLTGGPVWTTDSSPLAGGGGSLKFDGVDDYVDCGSGGSLNITDAITIEFWAKTGTQSIGWPKVMNRGGWSNGGYYVDIAGAIDTYSTCMFFGAPGGSSIVSPSMSYFSNIWNHIVYTIDIVGDEGKGYLNGEYQGTVSPLPAYISNSYDFYVVGTSSFNGSIDSVRIYNRALSAEEVRYHYNKGGPVAEWKFDEGSGQTAFDFTGNNNDGTVYGAAGTADSGTATTLTDAKSWTADEWIGETVTIHTGTCSAVSRTITDNDVTSITVSDWDSCTPDATSQYKITSKDEWTTGKYASAIDFDGVDDYVETSYYPDDGAKTLSFWFNPDNVAELYNAIGCHDANNHRFYLGLVNGGDIYCGIGDSYIFTTPSGMSNGNWYFYTVAADGSTARVYIDGVEKDNFSYSWTGDSTKTFWVGAINAANTHNINGSIDDVRIYPYARTADEIRLDYNAGVATHLGPSGKTCSEDPAGCVDYGLVGSWGMDEGTGTTAYDSSDNSNDGTLANGPTWTADSSPLAGGGGSLKFDGVDDYVDISYNNNLNVEAITIEAWIYPDGTQSKYACIAEKKWNSAWFFNIIWDERLRFFYKIGGTATHVYSTGTVTLNKWNHVVVTYDGVSNGKFYINNTGESWNPSPGGSLGTNTAHLLIGGNATGGDYNFNGSIDSVRIYNRALSAEEVRYHYNKGGPVAEWKFDEGSGQTAFDETSNNNDGTLGDGTCVAGAGTCPTWVEGKYGGGLSFDGGDDYVDAGDIDSLDGVSQFTLSAWVKPASFGNWKRVVSKDGAPSVNEGICMGTGSGVGSNDVAMVIHPTGADWALGSTTGDILVIGEWHHWVMVFNGSGADNAERLKFYFDGIQQSLTFAGNVNIPATTPITSYPVRIGEQNATDHNGLNGSIDDVRIYNYARTAEQIQMDYNAGVATHFR